MNEFQYPTEEGYIGIPPYCSPVHSIAFFPEPNILLHISTLLQSLLCIKQTNRK